MRTLAPVLICLAALTLSASPASAHAWLLQGIPGPNQHVAEPPRVLFLQFTENVEREHTGAEVFDLNRTRVDTDTVLFSDQQRNEIRVPLKPLPNGVYTVRWYTLSVDTHTASGSYLFAVGNASLEGAALVGGEHGGHDGHGPEAGGRFWGEAFGRAVYYVGLLPALGIPLAYSLVAPALRQGRPPLASTRLLPRVATLAGLGATLGALLVLLSFARRLDLDWTTAAATTRTGKFLALRLGAVLLASVAFAASAALRREAVAQGLFLVGGVLALVAVVTTSLSSHAASVFGNSLLNVGADLAHLLAGAVWTGGLLTLLVLLRKTTGRDAGRLVVRFSPLAVASVAILFATGLFASLLHLQAVSDLWTSAYGAAILVKASLLAPLVGLGALNKFWLGPRLEKGTAAPRHLKRTVLVEACILVVVLAAAGVLATAAPPGAGPPASGEPGPFTFEKTFEMTHLVVEIRPNPPTVGLQNFTATLHPLGSAALPNGTQVYLKLAPPGQPEPESVTLMRRAGPNQWTIDGGFFTERGLWTVYVVVQRPDEFAKAIVEVTVQ